MKFDESFWDNKYKTNKTGWDLGQVSPPLKAYFDQLTNKELKILIPGGGNSHEAEYLLNNGFTNVYVVDISKLALDNLKQRVPNFPSSNLIHQNFFELEQTFDLIIEQTFFCALNPNLRKNYVNKMYGLLKENGKLVGLLFDVKLNEDHPPFGGSKGEYLNYFTPYFSIEIIEKSHNSVPSRLGRELFIKLKKASN
ncbi:MAG: methyltransferase domain-containing protein [Polaribacter sp.]|jgi:methyl halide transferase